VSSSTRRRRARSGKPSAGRPRILLAPACPCPSVRKRLVQEREEGLFGQITAAPVPDGKSGGEGAPFRGRCGHGIAIGRLHLGDRAVGRNGVGLLLWEIAIRVIAPLEAHLQSQGTGDPPRQRTCRFKRVREGFFSVSAEFVVNDGGFGQAEGGDGGVTRDLEGQLVA